MEGCITQDQTLGSGAGLSSEQRGVHNAANGGVHDMFSQRIMMVIMTFSFVVSTPEVGIDPFSLGISVDDPIVLEVH